MPSADSLVAAASARRNGSWLSRLAVAEVALLLGAGVWFVGDHVPRQERAALGQVEELLSLRADSRKSAIEQWVADGLADAVTLASLSTVAVRAPASAAAPERRRLDAQMRRFVADQGYLGALIQAQDGSPAACVGVCGVAAPSSLAEPAGRAEAGGRSAHFGRLADGRPVVAFGASVAEADGGQPVRALVFADPGLWLYPHVLNRPLSQPSSEAFLVEPSGAEIVYVSPVGHPPGPALGLRRPLGGVPTASRIAVRGGEEFGRFPDYREVPVLAATRRIAPVGWGLVVKVDAEEVFGPLRARLAATGAAGGVGLASLLAAVYLLARAGERRLALAAARSQARLAHVLEQASDAILFAELDGKILAANRRAEEMYGLSHAELLGRSADELSAPEAAERAEPAISEAARRGGLVYETQHRRSDGASFPVELSVQPVSEDERRFLVAIVRDITRRKQTQQRLRVLADELEQRVLERTAELQAANRELESFSYSVSHDLRAPLRAIDGFARILEEDHADRLDAEGLRLLGVVRASARQMGALIDDLLAFSRLGRQQLRTARVDMADLARTAFAEAAAGIDPERLDFRLGALPPATGDAALLRQVWANLFSNALKFSAPRPRRVIEVSGERRNGHCVYRVADNGVGFEMRHAHKLFGVFQRLHSPTEFDGTGVGLALVQRVVQRHGGSVAAEGRGDEGASFSFTLPEENQP